MLNWLPWLEYTPEQEQAIKNLAARFGMNIDEYNSRLLNINSSYYNLVSYTLRSSAEELSYYLRGTPIRTYYDNDNNYDYETIKKYGRFEYTMLGFIASFSNEIKALMESIFFFRDRGGTSREDPINADSDVKVKLIYLPKGITDFDPQDKVLNEELTALFQREIIKENAKDPGLENSPDKTITIKIFNELPNSENKFIHVYFNKKSPQTLRRLIYKTIKAAINYFSLANTINCSDPENPTEITLFNKLINVFFDKDVSNINNIINELKDYIDQKNDFENQNAIKIFAAKKQTAMNQTRKNELVRNYDYAKNAYENNLREFAILRNNYLQTKKSLDTFEEINFTAIEVLLNKIKEHPGTKQFMRLNEDTLQFLIEEPLIHSESETWAKILANSASEINAHIKNFAIAFFSTYETTIDILRYAVQRLIKEIFVDQKIRLFTAVLLGIDASDTTFKLNKYVLTDTDYMPHPHIGTSSLTCWAEASRMISKDVMENDGETAFLQLIYALQQMTASDTIVSRKLIDLILNGNYSDKPIYLRKNEQERTTFKNLIKEFITDETNKINAIDASES